MKAVVFKGIGSIALEEVPEPTLVNEHDAIVRLTKSAICGTDLHFIRGTIVGVQPGTILGHEGVGVVEEVGSAVTRFYPGQRVLVPSTLACGQCTYCHKSLFSQCDGINPRGKHAGTVFFGGGGLQGMQTELVRVPLADVNLFELPDSISDQQAILISDVFPTAMQAIHVTHVQPGQSVAVFGCGPIGQAIIALLPFFHAGTVFAVDNEPSRLAKARQQGAQPINFDTHDPVKTIAHATQDNGADCVIDAVGIDARMPQHSWWTRFKQMATINRFTQEAKQVYPDARSCAAKNWLAGNAPSQVVRWAIASVAKAGTFSIIGVYPDAMTIFPLGDALSKNLTIVGGICNHSAYIPRLLSMVESKELSPDSLITQTLPLDAALDGYRHFDQHHAGWIKIVLSLN